MTELVASVTAGSTEEMLRAARETTDGADLIELRVDSIRHPDLERLRNAGPQPLIFTCRPERQGGFFQGEEDDRRALLRRALDLGFDFVDVELDTMSQALRDAATTSRVIVSQHYLEGFPQDSPAIVARAVELGADVVKLAARTSSLAEALLLADAGRPARERGAAFAPVAMGPAGTAGRVLAPRLEAAFTYASARGLPPTGPGQLGLDEMLGSYRFRSIDSSTEVYGILGRPALDSLSPAMHNTYLAKLGLNAVYVPFEEDDLPSFVAAARKLGVSGLSVTRPHKESIVAMLDELDEQARRVGAVNTVLVRDGQWKGFNTDVDGVVGPVTQHLSVEGKLAVILGAGGAARAAAVGLADRGAKIVVLARAPERAGALASLVGGDAGRLDELGGMRWDILINATPLSRGVLDQEQSLSCRPGSLVLDMVYDPDETELLVTAKNRGAIAVPGLEMLAAQAVRQAEIWTGTSPTAEELKQAARKEIQRRVGSGGPDRYSRQVLFKGIGEKGQRRIGRSHVLVVGLGALGSVSSEMLARAGVGFLRVLDRDDLDWSNLQRQGLYDEDDLAHGLPKAVAAAARLRKINREIEVEEKVVDLGPDNVEELMDGIDLVIDGTDNFETRYLLNDACIKLTKPWIYAACVGSYGMSFVIRPGKSPCLRCLLEEEPPPGTSPTCDTAGVIAPVVHAVAAFQVAEGLKLLVGDEASLLDAVFSIDVWTGQSGKFSSAKRRKGCPACEGKRFDYLSGKSGSGAVSLCGRNAVQVRPGAQGKLNLEELATRLRPLGEVRLNPYLVRFKINGQELVVFEDGRAIVHGTDDLAQARSLYSRYIGL
jgi:adenylyltransferase/sulfurtransferase